MSLRKRAPTDNGDDVQFYGVNGGLEATGKSCIWSNDGAVLAQAEAIADMCDSVNFQWLLVAQPKVFGK